MYKCMETPSLNTLVALRYDQSKLSSSLKVPKRFFSWEEEEMKIGLWILHVSFNRSKEHPAAEVVTTTF